MSTIGKTYTHEPYYMQKADTKEEFKSCDWWEKKSWEAIINTLNFSNSDTTLSLWKRSFSKNKEEAFLWDNLFWWQNKRDVIIKAYVLSHYIKKLQWDYIGIMLPSLGSVPIIILATYLAGKIPVMFNWTFWKESFRHCVDFSQVDVILTSKKFFEKIDIDFLYEYKQEEKFVFLEEMLHTVPLHRKIQAFCKSMYMPIPEIPKTAVVLFTSWSETLPKAVELTHQNIIENIRWVLGVFELKQDDRLMSFLPAFHSFGFTVNVIMPLITGLQVVYTPDPNDAKTISKLVGHTQATGITSTPTFLKMILSAAKKGDLESVRYVVVWAEKCSENIAQKFYELCPDGKILEWYGITECSPVVSMAPIEKTKLGTVGKILPNLDCKILDVDTKKEVSEWKQGMIYISGPSVFDWYIDKSIESPFEDIKGKSYYKTGDIWVVDTDGYLSITGRQKRFVKIAGEMVSLPYIEAVLLKKYESHSEIKVAVEAHEDAWETKIILFSIDDLALQEVNEYLREEKLSSIIKISHICIIEKIPLLGNGKVDYRSLKTMIPHVKWRELEYNFEDVEWTLKLKLSQITEVDISTISCQSIFWKDIILDSIDVWELMVFIQKKYNIDTKIDIKKIHSFNDLLQITQSLKNI